VNVLHFLGIGRVPKRPLVDATGGTERTALEIARIQKSRGYDVTVASMADNDWQGSWQGVQLMHLQPYRWARLRIFGKTRDFRRTLPLAILIRLGRFDLIHLHEHLETRFFSTHRKVMHFHNDPLADRDAATFAEDAPRYWAQVGKSSAQIAVSEFVANRLRLAHEQAGLDAPPANIVRLPGGVDSSRFFAREDLRKHTRQRFGLKDTDVLFLFAGAIRPEKGVDYLARAFARLSEENCNVYLVIAGGTKLWLEAGWLQGRELATTEQEVLNILAPAIARKRAFMLGIVSPNEIGAYYAASDVFILPSMFQETFGLVILEAFAAGLPVIAFRSGGIPELVEDQKNGVIVAQGDGEALYQSMRTLALDPNLRVRLGSAAQRVPPRFTWENTVDRLETIYQDVMKR
jgi:glycosyltransferase involved in cell wall biosynthesis